MPSEKPNGNRSSVTPSPSPDLNRSGQRLFSWRFTAKAIVALLMLWLGMHLSNAAGRPPGIGEGGYAESESWIRRLLAETAVCGNCTTTSLR